MYFLKFIVIFLKISKNCRKSGEIYVTVVFKKFSFGDHVVIIRRSNLKSLYGLWPF